MTTSKPRSPTPAQDICQQQQKIIANLRHENASLVQTVQNKSNVSTFLKLETTSTLRYQILSLRILVCHLYMLKIMHYFNNKMILLQEIVNLEIRSVD